MYRLTIRTPTEGASNLLREILERPLTFGS